MQQTRILEVTNSPLQEPQSEQFCQLGRAVIRTELEAIAGLEKQIDHNFSNACRMLLRLPGQNRGHGHWQIRPHRAQGSLDDGQHRNTGVVCASRRSQPRRHGDDHPARCDRLFFPIPVRPPKFWIYCLRSPGWA